MGSPLDPVGRFYENFYQTTDEEVSEVLARSRRRELSGADYAVSGR